MSSDEWEGWYIHKQPAGNTSAYVVFLTKEGVLRGYYKGARTAKKQAALQPFTLLWFNTQTKRDACFIQKVEAKQAAIAFNAQAFIPALYVNELIYLTQQPLNSCEALYLAYTKALSELASSGGEKQSIEAALRSFEWELLTSSGYAPDASSISPELNYLLVIGEGFVEDNKGIKGAHWVALTEDNFNAETLQALKPHMRHAISQLLNGKRLRTRQLVLQKAKIYVA